MSTVTAYVRVSTGEPSLVLWILEKYQDGVTTSVPDSKEKYAPAGKGKGHPFGAGSMQ